MRYKLTKSHLQVCVGKYSAHIYFPHVVWNNFGTYGIFAKTTVVIHGKSWKWDWAGGAELLGFGVGIAKNYTYSLNKKKE